MSWFCPVNLLNSLWKRGDILAFLDTDSSGMQKKSYSIMRCNFSHTSLKTSKKNCKPNGSWLLGDTRRQAIGGYNIVKLRLDESYIALGRCIHVMLLYKNFVIIFTCYWEYCHIALFCRDKIYWSFKCKSNTLHHFIAIHLNRKFR